MKRKTINNKLPLILALVIFIIVALAAVVSNYTEQEAKEYDESYVEQEAKEYDESYVEQESQGLPSGEKIVITDDIKTEKIPEDITEGVFEYKGSRYRYNDHLSNFLFLGIDKRQFQTTENGNADAGQCDALYVMSQDRVTNEVRMISIPRDTITQIQIYYLGGENSYYADDHISLSYAYGDGRFGSCEMSRLAVSNLLHNMPIREYCSLALDSLTVLGRNIDGVKVRVPDDSLAYQDENYSAGSEVTIDEDNIELYLRTRDINTTNSAIFRLNRQKEYLSAFMLRLGEKYKEDPGVISHLFLDLKPYMVTNMTTDSFVNLMGSIQKGPGIIRVNVPGDGVFGEEYDEFRVNQEEFSDVLVKNFCVKVFD